VRHKFSFFFLIKYSFTVLNKLLLFSIRVRVVKGTEGEDVLHETLVEGFSRCLRMSRSFGDFYLKQNRELSQVEQASIALPEVTVHPRNNSEDVFLLLASDGVWDVMRNQEAVDLVGTALGFTVTSKEGKEVNEEHCGKTQPTTISPEIVATACEKLLIESLLVRRGYDNMTVVAVVLNQLVDGTLAGNGPIVRSKGPTTRQTPAAQRRTEIELEKTDQLSAHEEK
jgi:serine/threonine protein phosphatase PrpC